MDGEQFVLQRSARQCVERRERLVHQQDLRADGEVRAIATRWFIPSVAARA